MSTNSIRFSTRSRHDSKAVGCQYSVDLWSLFPPAVRHRGQENVGGYCFLRRNSRDMIDSHRRGRDLVFADSTYNVGNFASGRMDASLG